MGGGLALDYQQVINIALTIGLIANTISIAYLMFFSD